MGKPPDGIDEATHIACRRQIDLVAEGDAYAMPAGDWTEAVYAPPQSKLYRAGEGLAWHVHSDFTHDSVIETGAAELQYRDGRRLRYGDGYDLRRVVVDFGLEHAIVALLDGTRFVNTPIPPADLLSG